MLRPTILLSRRMSSVAICEGDEQSWTCLLIVFDVRGDGGLQHQEVGTNLSINFDSRCWKQS